MGQGLSVAEWDMYEHLKGLLVKHGKEFVKEELKRIIKWIFHNFPSV